MDEKMRNVRPIWSTLAALVAVGFLVLPSAVSSRTPEAEAAVVSGRAKVIDGDTIDIAGTRIRLEGIDAPESKQMCKRKGRGLWSCGAEATAYLKRMTGGRQIACVSAGEDRYGRMLGWCKMDGRDINREMVANGFAWAFVRYSKRYVPAEQEARKAKAGVWQGEAEPAWDFRARRRARRLGHRS